MAKHFFQSWLPSPEKVNNMKIMKIFGNKISSPQLWYVNRKSIERHVLTSGDLIQIGKFRLQFLHAEEDHLPE